MQRSMLIDKLILYIAENVLDGRTMDLDEATPLLEWGIINSLEIVRLLSYVRKEFNVEISIDNITSENFVNLASIADLILQLSASRQAAL